MTTSVIKTRDEVKPEWLTGVLARSGALEAGAVDAIEFVEELDRDMSTNFRLRVSYEPGSSGELPEALFLKLVDTRYDDDDDPLQTGEVDYYTRDYADVEGVPLVRCYGAEKSDDGRYYYVLLEDVSATHVMADEKLPSVEHWMALADGFAAMHARWWGADGLRELGQPVPSAEFIERFAAMARPGVEHIIECCSDELEPHWPQAMRDIFEHHTALLIERTRNLNGFTLIHCDPNGTNILVPREGVPVEGIQPIYLIDRGAFEWSLTIWPAVYDLAYAFVLPIQEQSVGVRRAMERQVLEHYHAGLVQRGVANYSFEQLWDDYRLMVPLCAYVAIEFCRDGVNPARDVWMPKLRHALTAMDDLNCAELWNGKGSN